MGFIFNRKKKVSKDGTKINFLWAIPMYKEEIEYKLEEGFEAMMDLFTEVGFPRVLDPKRQNYIGGKMKWCK